VIDVQTPETHAPEAAEAAAPYIESAEAETERIIRSGTLWLGAVVVTAALLLGPAVAAGWRPTDLPSGEQLAWWIGAVAAGLGTAALVWAGCPTLGYPVAEAWRQKRMSIRFGIVASLAGIAISGIAVLIAPVA
jgi:cation transport ATPase